MLCIRCNVRGAASESGALQGCLDLPAGVTAMVTDGYTTIAACVDGTLR
jgi:hypothetical protein